MAPFCIQAGLEVRYGRCRHFFGRLEIIPPLLSGRLPWKLLHPDAFPRHKIRQQCVCTLTLAGMDSVPGLRGLLLSSDVVLESGSVLESDSSLFWGLGLELQDSELDSRSSGLGLSIVWHGINGSGEEVHHPTILRSRVKVRVDWLSVKSLGGELLHQRWR